jgi:hypothetical protein
MANLGRKSYNASVETQARAQYFQFRLEVEDALTGKLLEGTRTNNGSSGGTFRGSPGIYVNERRMRLIMGIPANDGLLIRPQDEPPTTRVVYDWGRASAEALFRRPELRRTKWEVKRREMELAASQNLLMPNLDVVGRYRFRGFGDSLINSYRNAGKAPDFEFDNAFQSLTSGEFQEWQLGFEFSMPFGFRQAHTAVRNAELQLSRSRAVLREQEHQILHDLSDSISEVDRAYVTMETSYNRLRATKAQLDSVEVEIELGAKEADAPLFALLLQSQRQFTEAQAQFYQTRVEYALSLKNVHFEKGTLLDYSGVRLSEGPWPNKAFIDALGRDCRRGREHRVRPTRRNPPFVSQGAFPQETLMEPGTGAELMVDPFSDDPNAPFEPVPMGTPDAPPVPGRQSSEQNAVPQLNEGAVFAPISKLARKISRIGRKRKLDSAGDADGSHEVVSAPAAEPVRQEVIGQELPLPNTAPPPPWNDAVSTGSRWRAPQDGTQAPANAESRLPWAPVGGLPPRPGRPELDPAPGTTGSTLAWTLPAGPHEMAGPDRRPAPMDPPPQWQLPPSAGGHPGTLATGQPYNGHSSQRQPGATVSVHMSGDGETERASSAGTWAPADEPRDAVAAPQPVSQTPVPFAPSLRLVPQRRVERFVPRDPSASQLRILTKEPPRRLPPVE